MNCGRTTLRTVQRGKWLKSTTTSRWVAQAAVIRGSTWLFLWVIPSTSQPTMAQLAPNCGRTIPPTVRRGGWLIFTAVQPVVALDLGWKSLLAIRCTSPLMTGAPVLSCGRIVRQPSISTRTPVAPLPRGPSVAACPAASHSTPPTEPSTVHRPNCGRKPPTRSGPTTAVAQASPTSTSPWLTMCRPSRILQPVSTSPTTPSAPTCHSHQRSLDLAKSLRGLSMRVYRPA